jgi:hypothetical protein
MRTVIAPLALVALLAPACGGAPEPTTPATPPAPPAPEASATPTPPPAPPAPAAPVTPAKLSVFAEGWGLSVRVFRGRPVLYDRYFGSATVDGDKVERASFFDGVDHPDDARVTMLTMLDSPTALLTVARPGAQQVLYRRGDAAFASLGPIPYRGFSNVNFHRSKGGDFHALLWSASTMATVELPDGAPAELDPKSPKARALPGDVTFVAHGGLANGDLVVLGAKKVDGGPADARRAVSVHLPAGAAAPTVTDLPEAFPNAKSGRIAISVCGEHDGALYAVRDAWESPSQSKAYLLVFRDGAWKVASGTSPDTTGVGFAGCAVTPDGAVWVGFASNAPPFGDSRLFRVTPGGAWSTVALPELPAMASKPKLVEPKKAKRGIGPSVGSEPLATPARYQLSYLYASAAGELFVNAYRVAGTDRVAITDRSLNEPRTVVLRSGEPRAGGPVAWADVVGDVVPRLLGVNEPAPAKPEPPKPSAKPEPAPATPAAKYGPPKPGAYAVPPPPPSPATPSPKLVAATPACTNVFVALYAVAPSTPADYDFPLTRAALLAKPELVHADFVEVEIDGKRTFGAIPPSYAAGKDLVALIESRVAGAKPQLLCGEPRILRTVPMELPTKVGPRATTPPPTVEEWNAASEVTVKGSSALGCETKRVREWMRVSCRGKSKAGATPVDVRVDRGPGPADVFTFAKGGVVSIVYPFAEGSDVAATFTFSDGPHTLVATWPQGGAAPSAFGEMK